ncbi:pyridoxal phosphate-dependent transferase [Entophlyctis helioformis]|nr:pyridoxal phosphate-dependent transferase [Entophlyctis helioformis]
MSGHLPAVCRHSLALLPTPRQATTMKMWNFSAGPGVLPKPVLQQAQAELLDFQGTGCSLMELSHRSPQFEGVLNKAIDDLRTLLKIPANYKVLFLQGGASTQFATVVYNLVGHDLDRPVDYIVSGVWSERAAKEAQLLGANVRIVATSKATGHDGQLVPARADSTASSASPSSSLAAWQFSPDAAYVYYCDNETVHGVEFEDDFVDRLPVGSTVVCDVSSNFLSRPIDVAKYGILFAGAQKNAGPAGVTIAIVREDLLRDTKAAGVRAGARTIPMPTMLDLKVMADNNSLYNTPPTFAIYVTGLVLQWVLDRGGVAAMQEARMHKSQQLYDAIAAHAETYECSVKAAGLRSRMNVPFRIVRKSADGRLEASAELEKAFLGEAEARGMMQLKGHRSVGGIRASLYNALDEQAVAALVAFMGEFAARHAQ